MMLTELAWYQFMRSNREPEKIMMRKHTNALREETRLLVNDYMYAATTLDAAIL